MSERDLSRLDDDALDALVAALDPLDVDAPDPDAASTQAMLDGILGDVVQPLPLWRRRGPLLLAGVVALGSAAAALSLLIPDVDEPFALACHASLTGDASVAAITTEGVVTVEDAEDRCRQVLREGTIGEDGVAAAQGELVVCTDDGGGLAVYPASSCAEVAAAAVEPADPRTATAPADFAAIRTAVADLLDVSGCLSASELEAAFADVVDGTDVAAWPVERRPSADRPGTCAGLTIDAQGQVVHLLGTPDVEASAPELVELDDLDAAQDALFAALWETDECVALEAAERRLSAALAGTAFDGFAVAVDPAVTPAGTCLDLREVDVDGRRVLLTPSETATP